MRVRDGEGIAALAVAGGEVILEIHAPKLIWTVTRENGSEHGVVRFLFF
jgi:hypothetical protein